MLNCDGLYLLSAGLAAAALPPVPQAVTAASVLVGHDVFFRPARVDQRSAQLALLLSETGDRGRGRGGDVGGAREVRPSFRLASFRALLAALGFLHDFLQNEEGVLGLSRLLDDALHHFLLVTHGSGEIEFQ